MSNSEIKRKEIQQRVSWVENIDDACAFVIKEEANKVAESLEAEVIRAASGSGLMVAYAIKKDGKWLKAE